VLALGSIFAGWLATPWKNVWDPWLQAVLGAYPAVEHGASADETLLVYLTLAIAAAGILLAFFLYGRPSRAAERTSDGAVCRVLAHKYYIDEFYDFVLVRPFTACARWLAGSFDPGVIDGIVNGVAGGVRATSLAWRRVQSGNVQHYLLAFLAGTLLIFAFFLGW
jgi:NADH-quinone oxidoreductase subunit L